MKTYQAKNGNIQYKPSFEQLTEAAESYTGFCLACGAENDGVEPDARKYACACCGAAKVYGSEELLFMNLYH